MTDAKHRPPTLPALPAGLRWRILGPADLERVEALHREALSGLAPSVVKPETHDFLESILRGRGRAVGIEDDREQLVAYGFLQHDLLPSDDPRAALGLPAAAPMAKLAGAAVAPDRRGAGLQRLLIRARVSVADPRQYLFATASPLNPASWISLLDEGFAIRRLEYRYGGHARFLHVRAPQADTAVLKGETRDIVGDDIPGHAGLLSEGWVGVQALPDPPRVRYQRLGAQA